MPRVPGNLGTWDEGPEPGSKNITWIFHFLKNHDLIDRYCFFWEVAEVAEVARQSWDVGRGAQKILCGFFFF